MRSSLTECCRLFLFNRDVVKSAFLWESSYMYPVCASIITNKGLRADEDGLRGCQKLLNQKTGIFSSFRSTAKLAMIAMMSVDNNPEEKLNKALQVYDCLKEQFWSSPYLSTVSMMIAETADPTKFKEIADHTRRIYELMKNDHPFLTSSENIAYAALIALSQQSDGCVLSEAENCYRLLKSEFFSGSAVQSLSYILALCEGEPRDKCDATVKLFRDLKSKGYKYGTGYELATLGTLAMLPEEQEIVVQELIEVDAFLAKQKGYGVFGLGKKQRLMHAGMIVAGDYLEDNRTMQETATQSVITLVVAQQAAMCAAIAASMAASSAGSNAG